MLGNLGQEVRAKYNNRSLGSFYPAKWSTQQKTSQQKTSQTHAQAKKIIHV